MEQSEKTLDMIVNLCKNRGYVFPGSEIYGGLANSWDYGPLGVEFKNNVKKAWLKKFVQESPYNVGLDAAIIMNPQTWVTTGHVSSFSDPLLDCRACKARHRADKLIGEEHPEVNVDAMSFDEMDAFIAEHEDIVCPVCGKDLLLGHLQLLCDQLFQRALLAGTAQHGQHIHLLVEGSLIVDLAVHVDGHAGDHQQVAVQCHQTGYDSAVLLHQHTTRHRQRTIHPCGADHAAVALGVQLGVVLPHVDLGVLLDAEAGRIGMGGGNVEAVIFQLVAHAEGNDAGTVAADKIVLAGFQRPLATFQQLGKACLQQDIPHSGGGVVCGGVAVDEGQHFTDFGCNHKNKPPWVYLKRAGQC